MMKSISIISLLFVFTFLGANAQSTSSYNSVLFSKGTILDLRTGEKFTGRLEEKYDNGKIRSVSLVKSGKLYGSSKIFYPTGQTHFIIAYNNNGELEGVITEYFENGEMKFQAEVTKQNRYGGNDLKGFFYAYYDGDQYKNKYKPSGRIQLLSNDGLSAFFNGEMPPHKIDGYRVFINKMANYGFFIEDSRDIICPEAREPGVNYKNWSPGK